MEYQKNSQSSNYILVMFDGYRIRQISKLGIDGDPQYMRGVYIDGYLYAFGENSPREMFTLSAGLKRCI